MTFPVGKSKSLVRIRALGSRYDASLLKACALVTEKRLWPVVMSQFYSECILSWSRNSGPFLRSQGSWLVALEKAAQLGLTCGGFFAHTWLSSEMDNHFLKTMLFWLHHNVQHKCKRRSLGIFMNVRSKPGAVPCCHGVKEMVSVNHPVQTVPVVMSLDSNQNNECMDSSYHDDFP